MGITLRQETQMRGGKLQPVECHRLLDEPRRGKADGLDLHHAEMLVHARAPDDIDAIAGLKQRLHAAGASAAHQTHMTAMLTRHQFKDGAGFPVPPRSKDNTFVSPFHGRNVALSVREFKAHFAVTLRIIAPIVTNLDEEEQVHLLLKDFHQFLARRLADGFDRLALMAENDLLLAVALDVDDLLECAQNRPAFLPSFPSRCVEE